MHLANVADLGIKTIFRERIQRDRLPIQLQWVLPDCPELGEIEPRTEAHEFLAMKGLP